MPVKASLAKTYRVHDKRQRKLTSKWDGISGLSQLRACPYSIVSPSDGDAPTQINNDDSILRPQGPSVYATN